MKNHLSFNRNTRDLLFSQVDSKHKSPIHRLLARAKTTHCPSAWLMAVMIAFIGLTAGASAQEESSASHARAIKIDSSVVTEHETKILGKRVKYSATTGTQPVWNSKDEAVALYFIRTTSEPTSKIIQSARLSFLSTAARALRQCGCM